MAKEWGGYLPLEQTLQYNDKQPLFADVEDRYVLRLNSARNAICFIMQTDTYKKIWIPLYMCLSIKETLERYDISYEVYNIDSGFNPIVDFIPEQDIILVCNYFGLKDEKYYDECVNKYGNVIFDNTQALFREPVLKGNVFNVYSYRKFVGVSDGALLIGTDICNNVYQQEYKGLDIDRSSDRASYLVKSVELTTNGAYKEYLESELHLGDIRQMSPLTKSLLRNIEYEKIAEIRLNNYSKIKSKLESYNEIHFNESDITPMCYPLYVENDGLRNSLVQKKIYVPQWWKWILDDERANSWERNVSKWLLPIPIDQRYGEEEMLELAGIIIDCLGVI